MTTLGAKDTPKAWDCFMGALLIGGLVWGECSGEGTGNLSFLFSLLSPLTLSSVPEANPGKTSHQCQHVLSDFLREVMNY